MKFSSRNYPTYEEKNGKDENHGLEDSWTSGKQTEEIRIHDPPCIVKQAPVQLKIFTKGKSYYI